MPTDETPRLLGDLEPNLPLAKPGPQVVEHQIDDALDLGLGQGPENDDLVEPVPG